MKDMTITRAQAIAVLAGIGFRTADKWDDTKIKAKFVTLHEMVDGSEPMPDKETKTLFENILATTKGGGKILLEGGEEPAEKPKAEKPADAPAAEEPAKDEKPKADKKTGGKKDKPAPAGKSDKKAAPAEKPKAEKPAPKARASAKGDATYKEQVKHRTFREGSQLQIIASIFAGSKAALSVEDVVAAAKKKGTKVTEARVKGAVHLLGWRNEVKAGKEEGTFIRA